MYTGNFWVIMMRESENSRGKELLLAARKNTDNVKSFMKIWVEDMKGL